MNTKPIHYFALPILLLLNMAAIYGTSLAQPKIVEKPNVVVILADDLGYGDLGCYGAEGFSTPNLDKMAAGGIRFTDFYVASSVCSPSRAALMTGCYAQNVGLPEVLHPWSATGIHPEETTLAETFKSQGYHTAAYGKWHLGHHPEFRPGKHGFDEFYGIPYSNDMWPNHPTKPNFFPDLPLIENDKVVELNPDQTQFTIQFTNRAIDFIEQYSADPFFIYLAHPMPHVPLFVSEKFAGKSNQGLYGDVIMELDWSVGRILQTLKQQGIGDKTMVIFTSDNGPWLSYGDHAGSAGRLRDGKTTTFEGGQRVPCIMRWPGSIPEGLVCREMATSMDLLPTLARLIGAPLPQRHIDGLDIWPLISVVPNATTPHEAFYYYDVWKLDAVRSGQWKLQLPHKYFSVVEPGSGGLPGQSAWKYTGLSLYDLEHDPGEQHDVALEHPEIVNNLVQLAAKARKNVGDAEKKVVEGVDFFDSRTYYPIAGRYNRAPGRIRD
jgi:arylsulfatase A-like enzyme